LQQSLETTIESCVNRVGVDLNTSSWTLLRYVAGITERVALNIVTHRDEHGRFRSRKQLNKSLASVPKHTSRLPVSCASATARIRWIALPSIRNRIRWSSKSPARWIHRSAS